MKDPRKQIDRKIETNRYVAMIAFVGALYCWSEAWACGGWQAVAWSTGAGLSVLICINAIISAASTLGFRRAVDAIVPEVLKAAQEARSE